MLNSAFHDNAAAPRLGPALQDTSPYCCTACGRVGRARRTQPATHSSYAHSPQHTPHTPISKTRSASILQGDGDAGAEGSWLRHVAHARAPPLGELLGAGSTMDPLQIPRRNTGVSVSMDEFSEVTGEGPTAGS